MVKVILTATIDAEVYKKLDEISKKEKIKKSKIVEEALKEYFKLKEEKNENSMFGAYPQLKPLSEEEEREIEGKE